MTKYTTIMGMFTAARKASSVERRDFLTDSGYNAARNVNNKYRKMAYTMVSAIAVGSLADDAASPEIKAWMRLADMPEGWAVDAESLSTAEHPWKLVCQLLGEYIRGMRKKEDKYRSPASPPSRNRA